MGINQERTQALISAVRNSPGRTAILGRRLFLGHPGMEEWLQQVRASERRPLFIVMIERFGDLVACSPIARQLKMQQPDLAIAWVCSARYSSVFAGNPWIDKIFHEEALVSWLISKSKLSPPFLCHELFLDSQRCCWTGIKLPGRFSGINRQNYLNEGSNLLLAYSTAAGIKNIEDIEPDLFLPPIKIELPRSLQGKPLLAIHFDSEDPDRCLNPKAAMAYVTQAIDYGWGVVELGLRPRASINAPDIFFPGSTLPLQAHISLLQTAQYFVGTDSGFLHCANALRKPATVFLGKLRQFAKPITFSGHFWETSWDCVHGDWEAKDCPIETALSHLPKLPGTQAQEEIN